MSDPTSGRLHPPPSVTHYSLWLIPHVEAREIHATALLRIDGAPAGPTLTLHSQRLRNIAAFAPATYGDGPPYDGGVTPYGPPAAGAALPTVVGPRETIVVDTAGMENGGRGYYELLIRYVAPIAEGYPRRGVFGSVEGDPYALCTQLEPTFARRLYPCVDEPWARATYDVAICFPAEYTVIGNTAVDKSVKVGEEGAPRWHDDQIQKLCSDWRWTIFERTPPISPYLVSFATGAFCSVQTRTSTNISVSVNLLEQYYTASMGMYALDLLRKALEYFASYFDFQLPLKKLDIVASPSFDCLGMENWGLIVLRADHCVVDSSTPIERWQRIARLVGHEVAHHWFGNVVSIEWWSYLWLKEGFARYLEYEFCSHEFPQWQMWNDFLVAVVDDCLIMDCNPQQTHPIVSSAATPAEIFRRFDRISYGKGASLLRMMSSVLGDEQFRQALRELVRRHAMKFVDQAAIVGVLAMHVDASIISPECFSNILSEWSREANHPYVYVQRQGSSLHIQQFFMPDLEVGTLSQIGYLTGGRYAAPMSPTLPNTTSFEYRPEDFLQFSHYKVPVHVVEVSQDRAMNSVMTLIDQHEQRWTPQFPQSSVWINGSGFGLCRCDGPISMWLEWFNAAPYLSSLDRLALTVSIFKMRRLMLGYEEGQVAESIPDRCVLLLEWMLQLSMGMTTDMNATLWSVIAFELEAVICLMRDHPCWQHVCRWVTAIFEPMVHILGFEKSEDPTDFQAHRRLSDNTVAQILRCCALCDCAFIRDEATAFHEWAMSHVVCATTERTFGMELNIHAAPTQKRIIASFDVVVRRFTARDWDELISIVTALFEKSGDEEGMDAVGSPPSSSFAGGGLAQLFGPVSPTGGGPTLQHISARDRWMWGAVLLNPLALCGEDVCFPAIAGLIADAMTKNGDGILRYGGARALLRNVPLVEFMLRDATTAPPPLLVAALWGEGASYTASEHLFRVLSSHGTLKRSGDAHTEALQELPPVRGTQTPVVREYAERFERNIIWAEYCSPMYEKYLSRRLSGGIECLTPRQGISI